MTPTSQSDALRYASDPSPEKASDVVRLDLGNMDPTATYEDRCTQTLRLAERAFSQTGSWVVFFREMFGPSGVVRSLFPVPEDREKYEKSDAYMQVQEMLAAIRSQDNSKGDANEPERMITIRLPKSLHETLAAESEEANLSINKLCITKLIQAVNSRFTPVQKGRRRGRRPGPQGPRVVSTTVSVPQQNQPPTSEATDRFQPPMPPPHPGSTLPPQ